MMTAPKPETIDRAAIRRYTTVWSVPRPMRHHDVIAFMAEQGVDALGDYSTQGFTTSEGRFVAREEAMRIARAAGQLIAEPHVPDMLFSEDIY